jgi:hypothetical protein
MMGHVLVVRWGVSIAVEVWALWGIAVNLSLPEKIIYLKICRKFRAECLVRGVHIC